MKKFIPLSVLTLIAVAGCQQDTKKTSGSYGATRHYQTGSNIPKPMNAESASDAYDPDRFANTQNQQSAMNNRAMSGGGR